MLLHISTPLRLYIYLTAVVPDQGFKTCIDPTGYSAINSTWSHLTVYKKSEIRLDLIQLQYVCCLHINASMQSCRTSTRANIPVRLNISQLLWPFSFQLTQQAATHLIAEGCFLYRCLQAAWQTTPTMISQFTNRSGTFLSVSMCDRQFVSLCWRVQRESPPWVTAGSATFHCWQTKAEPAQADVATPECFLRKCCRQLFTAAVWSRTHVQRERK